MRRVLLLVPVLFLLTNPLPAPASEAPWVWPLGDLRVDRDFDPPDSDYGPGHRGVDLAGHPGATVRSVAAGTVSFVGQVGGTDVLTISHGAERSTYQPVRADVEVGDAVEPGTPVGRLLGGHTGCGAAACLHLGRVRGEDYLDPLELLRTSRFRLIDPDGPVPAPPALGSGTGEFRPPVDGPVSSGFGQRVHPITGVRTLHDGIDIAAPCGTPVVAAADGTVTDSAVAGAYGLRVVVAHPGSTSTSYSHLGRTGARPGSSVTTGEVIGHVGSTGLSSGCHLHFSVHRDGSPVDPAPLL
ncbi:peptidoglycan DD-metalloendopeptidase family protein [Aeromicrobium marinum]|nr:peptidoglycan DD-metalloendopeptidase family protein [Aeromicrobium marinum]